ncbi:hypothetical protein EPUS_01247 [Endocarpon pusillum Z07020]|uniref:Uncharacterized protein n=1 Tax=Endocarpon pusillum (strain Z07020 / HMAS-L-300199) TaxID=1263415 RepID=U1GV07_ENDPU|nr:uncharacterized protein EPUS_01247 [Endocarpon pusillum Z07020]ERF75881.1 hypothetical protein EPUS_01247 [Endocarpon pusillum Z07020]
MDLPRSERLRMFDAEKARAFNEIQDYKKLASAGQTLVAGLRPGQLEICDGKPKVPSRENLGKRIMLKTTGPAGEYERAANAHELTATASVFATALSNNASTKELQTMADNLSKQGCLATNPHAATALKTLVHYMRTLQLCTARFLPNIERLRRGYYDFDVQLCCIELAIQLKAEQFGQCVVREVVRESFFLRLNLRQWRAVADKLHGMLDPSWWYGPQASTIRTSHTAKAKSPASNQLSRSFPPFDPSTPKPFVKIKAICVQTAPVVATVVADAIREARAIKARKAEKAARKAAEQAAKKAVKEEEEVQQHTGEGAGVEKAIKREAVEEEEEEEEEGVHQDTGEGATVEKAIKREAVEEAEKEETKKVKKSP